MSPPGLRILTTSLDLDFHYVYENSSRERGLADYRETEMALKTNYIVGIIDSASEEGLSGEPTDYARLA
jgi:hypothetical protein